MTRRSRPGGNFGALVLWANMRSVPQTPSATASTRMPPSSGGGSSTSSTPRDPLPISRKVSARTEVFPAGARVRAGSPFVVTPPEQAGGFGTIEKPFCRAHGSRQWHVRVVRGGQVGRCRCPDMIRGDDQEDLVAGITGPDRQQTGPGRAGQGRVAPQVPDGGLRLCRRHLDRPLAVLDAQVEPQAGDDAAHRAGGRWTPPAARKSIWTGCRGPRCS